MTREEEEVYATTHRNIYHAKINEVCIADTLPRKTTSNDEYLGCNEHQDAENHLQGYTVKRVKTFTYLGSTLAEDG